MLASSALVGALVLLGGCSGSDRAGGATTSSTTRPTTTATTGTTTTTTVVATTAPPPSTTTTVVRRAAGTHVYPVRPPSATHYDRSHHDYPAADVFAPCGSTVVAVTDGTVQEVSRVDTWNPKVNSGDSRGGLFVSIVGDDGVRYYGSHLSRVDDGIDAGVRVTAGQPIALVGETGDARGVGCHLHFGLSAPCGPGDWQRRRGEVAPQPYLDRWKVGQDGSPAGQIAAKGC